MKTKIHCVGINHPRLAQVAIAFSKQGHEVTGTCVLDYITDERMKTLFKANNILLFNEEEDILKAMMSKGTTFIINNSCFSENMKKVFEMQQTLRPLTYHYTQFITKQDKQRIYLLGEANFTKLVWHFISKVLTNKQRLFDYYLEQKEELVDIQLSDAPVIFIADERLISNLPLDKLDLSNTYFSLDYYAPHILFIDHEISHFEYHYEPIAQKMIHMLPKGGTLIYNQSQDTWLSKYVKSLQKPDLQINAYQTPSYQTIGKKTHIEIATGEEIIIPKQDEQTMFAIIAAYHILRELAITEKVFFQELEKIVI